MKKAVKKPATVRAAVKKASIKDLSVSPRVGGIKGGQIVAGGGPQAGVLQVAAAKMTHYKSL